jgi:hypothetical protein
MVWMYVKLITQCTQFRQIARLEEIKQNRDDAASRSASLGKLKPVRDLKQVVSHGDNPNNLLKLCIDAARERCTLGSSHAGTFESLDDNVSSTSVVQGAYSASLLILRSGNGGPGGMSDVSTNGFSREHQQ